MAGATGAGDLLALLGRQASIVTAVLAATSALSWGELLRFDLQLRLARGAGVLLHEHAHLLAALLAGAPRPVVLTRANLLGHVPLRQHLLQLLPGRRSEASTRVELPPCSGGLASVLVAAAGLLASLALLWASLGADLRDPFLCAAALNAALALASDGPLVLGRAGALPLGVFGCGNWGLLIPSSDKACKGRLLPRALVNLLEEVLSVVELRGGQAGGVCCFFSRSGVTQQVVARIVKAKRGPLASVLFSDLWRKLFWRRLSSCCRAGSSEVVLLQGHTRFGTSSPASVQETHPHQWLGEMRESFWQYDPDTQEWHHSVVPFCVTICHNGDFDEWQPYDDAMDVQKLGCWLSRVLNKPNAAAGDSPKMAGVMDLLIAKGCWFRAVRFAYTMLVMTHEEQVCGWEPVSASAPNQMPAEKTMRTWAKQFEAAFEHYFNKGLSPDKAYVPKKVYSDATGMEDDAQCGVIIEDLVGTISNLLEAAGDDFKQILETFVPNSVHAAFVNGVVQAFFQQDLLTATWQFFCRAKGTFGISVSCTTFPKTILLAAKGQPISVGFNASRGLVMWTSEPVSLPLAWPGGEGKAVKMRWDLRDSAGEILEVSVLPQAWTDRQMQLTVAFPAVHAPYFALPDRSGPEPSGPERQHNIVLRGCTIDTSPTGFTRESFGSRLGETTFSNFDIAPGKESAGGPSWWRFRAEPDPVDADIRQIPMVLKSIDANWEDQASLNVASAQNFARLLCTLASVRQEAASEGGCREIHVLVTGVENSHWIGQQFVADLARVFPMLNCVALSSNFVLGLLQEGAGHLEPMNFPLTAESFRLAPGAVCLAVSQSGTTYPTVWAARLLSRIPDCTVFAMSGHMDTVLGTSIGQSLADSEFHSTIFRTMAGVRPSEASTVASVAMHHTLTHLLLACAAHSVDTHRARRGCRRLKQHDIADLNRIVSALAPASERLCGVTAEGRPMRGEAHDELARAGAAWSSHLTEVYWATAFGALYVYVTVIGGVPPISTLWGLSLEATEIEDDPDWVPRVADATIYVFLPALISLAHRVLTGRRLWTRFCSRTVVIVDSSTMNYKLLRAYVTKLRALAFRFTTFGVLGQNATDHFVHEMTHLTTSETLVAVGRCDGRLASLASTEASVIMSLQQAKFIKKASTGIEAISLGHNPWTNPKLFRRHVALPIGDRPAFYSEHLLNQAGGESVEASRHLGCHPEHVLSSTTLLHSGQRQLGCELDAPRLTLAMLKEYMGGSETISRAEARELLKSIVEEQALELAVDPADFDAEKLIPKESGPKPWTLPSQSPQLGPSEPDLLHIAVELPAPPDAEPRSAKRGPGKRTFSRGRLPDPSKRLAGRLSLVNVMTIVRSDAMQQDVKRMKRNARRQAIRAWAAEVESPLSPPAGRRAAPPHKPKSQTVYLGELFHLWHDLVVAARLPRPTMSKKGRPGDWRQLELYRTVVRAQPMLSWMFGATLLKDVFHAWLQGARAWRQDKVEMVGSRWAHPTASQQQVLAAQQLLEHLYESRVAAAERLISFYVLFHRMVRPISRLPLLGFRMDKTESRLRVASTPAPVAMREPTHGPAASVDVFDKGCLDTKLPDSLSKATRSNPGTHSSAMVVEL